MGLFGRYVFWAAQMVMYGISETSATAYEWLKARHAEPVSSNPLTEPVPFPHH